MSRARAPRPPARRVFDWAFRSRVDGRIVMGQPPNLTIGVVTVAAVLAVVLPSRAAAASGTIAFGALAWWAFDELLHGVNPFRRAVGALALIGLVPASLAGLRR